MCTHNIGFYEDLTKINFELSSNTHLISSVLKDNFNQSSIRIFVVAAHLNNLGEPIPMGAQNIGF